MFVCLFDGWGCAIEFVRLKKKILVSILETLETARKECRREQNAVYQ